MALCLKYLRKMTSWFVVFLFSVIIIVVFSQVVLRYLFNNPPSWSEEIARFCQVWMVLLTSPICIRKGSHLAVDYLIGSFSPKINKFIRSFINILIFIYIPFIIIFGIKLFNIGKWQFSPALEIRMDLVYIIFPLSGILMLIENGLKTYEVLAEKCNAGVR